MRSLLALLALAASSLPTNALALTPVGRRTARSSPPSPSGIRMLESTVEKEKRGSIEDANGLAGDDDARLSPFLQGMVDEQRELQMNVGKAMDVLRNDYPYFLKRAPNYSIYHDQIKMSASDGQIQLSKLSSYKKAFGVVRNMLPLLYDADRSIIQSRMVYDASRTQIRVSFNAMLVPKLIGPLGSVQRTVHVDGISVYSIDVTPKKNGGEGKIVEHRLEKLLVNGAALQPPYFTNFGLEAVAAGRRGGALAGAGAWS